MHDLFDGGGEVPPVNVEDVDVVCLEFAEAMLDGDAHAFKRVAD